MIDIFSFYFECSASYSHLVALFKGFTEGFEERNLFEVKNTTFQLIFLTYLLYLSEDASEEHLQSAKSLIRGACDDLVDNFRLKLTSSFRKEELNNLIS